MRYCQLELFNFHNDLTNLGHFWPLWSWVCYLKGFPPFYFFFFSFYTPVVTIAPPSLKSSCPTQHHWSKHICRKLIHTWLFSMCCWIQKGDMDGGAQWAYLIDDKKQAGNSFVLLLESVLFVCLMLGLGSSSKHRKSIKLICTYVTVFHVLLDMDGGAYLIDDEKQAEKRQHECLVCLLYLRFGLWPFSKHIVCRKLIYIRDCFPCAGYIY